MKIETMAFGEVGIATALILASGTSGLRIVTEHAQISLYVGGENLKFTAIGNTQATDRQETKMRTKINELFAKYCDKPIDIFRNFTAAEKYIDATEAKELGLVDNFL